MRKGCGKTWRKEDFSHLTRIPCDCERSRQVCGFWNQATFMLLPGSASWGSKTREKNGYLLGAGWWDLRKPHNHSLWPKSSREAAAHAQSWEATWAGKMQVSVGTYENTWSMSKNAPSLCPWFFVWCQNSMIILGLVGEKAREWLTSSFLPARGMGIEIKLKLIYLK